jgi:hypothetical protein
MLLLPLLVVLPLPLPPPLPLLLLLVLVLVLVPTSWQLMVCSPTSMRVVWTTGQAW